MIIAAALDPMDYGSRTKTYGITLTDEDLAKDKEVVREPIESARREYGGSE